MADRLLEHEYLPASGEARQDLVLLHGWASGREIWRPLLAQVRDWANVTLIDLPFGCAAPGELDTAEQLCLERAVLACAPARAVYLGWSLGGQLAAHIAQANIDRASALVTLCTNPRFVTGPGWPGMAETDFRSFQEGVETDAPSTLRRFDSLQTQGSTQPRILRRELVASRHLVHKPQLSAGLALLESLDMRSSLQNLTQPQLHLFAQCDALVPAPVQQAMGELLAAKPSIQIATISGASHVAPIEAAPEVASSVFDFLDGSDLLYEDGRHTGEPRKTDIAESFSKAAGSYDSAAQLQREVGTCLLGQVSGKGQAPECVVDLGCGTGHFYPLLNDLFPRAHYIGLDLAPGMVRFARGRFPAAVDWLVADAESMPLATESLTWYSVASQFSGVTTPGYCSPSWPGF